MILLSIPVDLQHNQIMRLYARALKAKHRPKYSLGIICQWIGGLVNSPLLARSAYGSSVLCSRDESGTASRTKPFIGNSWRYFSELCSVFRYHLYRSNAPHRGGDFIRNANMRPEVVNSQNVLSNNLYVYKDCKFSIYDC